MLNFHCSAHEKIIKLTISLLITFYSRLSKCCGCYLSHFSYFYFNVPSNFLEEENGCIIICYLYFKFRPQSLICNVTVQFDMKWSLIIYCLPVHHLSANFCHGTHPIHNPVQPYGKSSSFCFIFTIIIHVFHNFHLFIHNKKLSGYRSDTWCASAHLQITHGKRRSHWKIPRVLSRSMLRHCRDI